MKNKRLTNKQNNFDLKLIKVNKEIHKRLKVYAAKNDLVVGSAIEKLLDESLKKTE